MDSFDKLDVDTENNIVWEQNSHSTERKYIIKLVKKYFINEIHV